MDDARREPFEEAGETGVPASERGSAETLSQRPLPPGAAERSQRSPDAPRRLGAGDAIGWRVEHGDWRIRFVGRGAPGRGALADSQLVPPTLAEAWARQVHSSRCVVARPGDCGEADALCLEQEGIAATIATADCLPVVVVGTRAAVAIHAGWRGLAAGVIESAIAALAGERDEGPLAAWIGPAIGACCYEVGDDVARQVAATSSPEVVRSRPGGDRPRLDLQRAAEVQLRRAGVASVVRIEACTRCHEEWLWSYRRDGARRGRNLAVVWREAAVKELTTTRR